MRIVVDSQQIMLSINYMTDELYNRIAALRTERGLSRKGLSEVLGVNYQTVGYLERSDYAPSLALALRIAEFFEVPVEMVFSRRPFEPLSKQIARMKREA